MPAIGPREVTLGWDETLAFGTMFAGSIAALLHAFVMLGEF